MLLEPLGTLKVQLNSSTSQEFKECLGNTTAGIQRGYTFTRYGYNDSGHYNYQR